MELTPDDRSFVFSVARRIVQDDDAASDATQDALLLAHRFRAQFRGESAYRTWLHRIAVTTALGHVRRRRRSREELAEPPAELSDPRPDPEHVVLARQLAARAYAALEGITADQRRVFLLRAEDHTEGEIARALGISIANVKIRAHRARRRLRRALAEAA